jgi:hypothetical protein
MDRRRKRERGLSTATVVVLRYPEGLEITLDVQEGDADAAMKGTFRVSEVDGLDVGVKALIRIRLL